jgi:hypothetical protein
MQAPPAVVTQAPCGLIVSMRQRSRRAAQTRHKTKQSHAGPAQTGPKYSASTLINILKQRLPAGFSKWSQPLGQAGGFSRISCRQAPSRRIVCRDTEADWNWAGGALQKHRRPIGFAVSVEQVFCAPRANFCQKSVISKL